MYIKCNNIFKCQNETKGTKNRKMQDENHEWSFRQDGI